MQNLLNRLKNLVGCVIPKRPTTDQTVTYSVGAIQHDVVRARVYRNRKSVTIYAEPLERADGTMTGLTLPEAVVAQLEKRGCDLGTLNKVIYFEPMSPVDTVANRFLVCRHFVKRHENGSIGGIWGPGYGEVVEVSRQKASEVLGAPIPS